MDDVDLLAKKTADDHKGPVAGHCADRHFEAEPADYLAELERLAPASHGDRPDDDAPVGGAAANKLSASEVLQFDLVDAARLVRNKAISSRELTEAVLSALDGEGRRLNATALLYAEEALASADAFDAMRAQGRVAGPLHGVPLAHKDMFYRKGKACASGSLARADFTPERNAAVIDRLDSAGAVDAGRLNMVEFALGLTGHNRITGHPKNPYNEEHLTGGSSSGPAASIAARLNFASLGSDTGGSIRVPSSACGLAGIKPTYGRVSRAGALPLSFTLDHVGPLARTVRDLALIMEIISGHDPDDATTSHRPVPAYLSEIERDPGKVRIGVPSGELEQAMDADIKDMFSHSLSEFESMGCEIIGIELPSLEALNALRRVIMYTEVATLHQRLIEECGSSYNQQTLARMRPGFHVDSVDYLQCIVSRGHHLRKFVRSVFSSIDILCMPTMPSAMPGIEATDLGGNRELVRLVNALGAYVCPFNYLGLPVVNVPSGVASSAVPTGIQLIGKPFDEAGLLRLAHYYEGATQFSKAKPKGC